MSHALVDAVPTCAARLSDSSEASEKQLQLDVEKENIDLSNFSLSTACHFDGTRDSSLFTLLSSNAVFQVHPSEVADTLLTYMLCRFLFIIAQS